MMLRTRTLLISAVLAGAIAAPAVDLLAQGRPSTPPGQANRPVTPPAKPSGPATPPGHGRASAPPVQPKAAAPIVVNPALSKNLQPLLPGLDVNAEAQGFRNLGAFVSAVHASRNLDIPFVTLKSKIVADGASLGTAIQTLKPSANAKSEAARAEKQAKSDIAAAGKAR